MKKSRKILDALNHMAFKVDPALHAHPQEEPAPLFIVGVPRAGTTLTYQLITHCFELAYFPHPVEFLYGAPNTLMRTLRRWLDRPPSSFESKLGHIEGALSPSEDAHFWSMWFPDDPALGHYIDPNSFAPSRYQTLFECIGSLQAIMDKPFVFKNLYLSMAVGALAQVFPKALFIRVDRDPLLTFQSMFNARMNRRNPSAWWSIKPPGFRMWESLELWQQVARQVFYADQLLRFQLENYAEGRHFIIQYDDLCCAPEANMSQLDEWLPHPRRSSANLPGKFPPSRALHLSNDLISRVRKEWTHLSEQMALFPNT